MGHVHKELAPTDHLYVLLFGSDPAAQGSGAGSALLTFPNRLAGADGVPSCLEAGGTKGPGFYAAKGGFQEAKRVPLVYSKGAGLDGGMSCVLRPAKPL
jgi:hypothetical protein